MAGAPLVGALLSLSGEGYRSNNQTDAAGVFTFHGLYPGKVRSDHVVHRGPCAPPASLLAVANLDCLLESRRPAGCQFACWQLKTWHS